MTGEARDLLVRGAAQLGVQLSLIQVTQFCSLADELKKWGKKVNLTAITRDADIAVKHFVDSLTLLNVVRTGGQLLDLGSGGGFPSIPLKIVSPELQVVSVDAVEKKVLFQRHAARLLHLSGFEAIHARGEALASTHAGVFDWVVSRAFSDIPAFVNIALPLIKQSGFIVAMKGKGGKEEVAAAGEPLAAMGARVTDLLEFRLPILGDARSIIIVQRAKPLKNVLPG